MTPPDSGAADERLVDLEDLIDDGPERIDLAELLPRRRRRGRHRARAAGRRANQSVQDSAHEHR